MEIIVPVYPALDGPEALRAKWPGVRFIDVPDEAPPENPNLEHWKYDRRRAVGLASARGEVIAMTEDRAIPGERWCAAIWDAHWRLDYEVIGGGVGFAGGSLFNRSVFYCDFGRYEPPFQSGVVDHISAANVSYKRDELELHKAVWEKFYDESEIHRRIQHSGGRLYITPDIALQYGRGPLSPWAALRQKLSSGRVFAARRAREDRGLRVFYAAFCPALAPLLFRRMFQLRKSRGQPMPPFRAAAPFVFLLLAFWSAGEFIGYVTAQPFPRWERSGK